LNLKSLLRKEVIELQGYRPEVQRSGIKLDANESPYPFPIKLNNKGLEINRYPDPEAKALKKALSKLLKVEPENILQGNGSDELIYYLISVTGGPVLYPVPTFSMYGIIARVLGEKTLEIPLDKDFDIPMESFLRSIKKDRPRIIFLSSPNNPTGNCFSEERILRIVKESNCLVVVDEAYQPYAENGEGFIPYTKRYKNLLVMRTFSKIGLAGIRLGFLVGERHVLNQINKARLPYNVNSLTQSIALEALKNRSFFKDTIKKALSERKRLFDAMSRIDGVKVFPSRANFILFKVRDGSAVHKGLLKKGVIVKNLSNLIPDCLRVTVGTPEENNAFLKALKEVL